MNKPLTFIKPQHVPMKVQVQSKQGATPVSLVANKSIEMLVVDAGNYNVKVRHLNGLSKFCSAILLNDSRELDQVYGPDDMQFRIQMDNGDIHFGLAGQVADTEGIYGGGRLYGDSKNHKQGRIRVLLAAALYADSNIVNLVIAQPHSRHSSNKVQMINSLIGTHSITINNGKTVFERQITIRDVKVVSEGGAFYFINPIENGIVHYIDVGSGTVNCVTFKDGLYVMDKSTTLHFGTEVSLDDEEVYLPGLADGICSKVSKLWKANANVYIGGGCANHIIEEIKNYFPNASVIRAVFEEKIVDPEFINVLGMYEMGLLLYGEEN